MVNKWPFITVASVLNSLLVTTAFINLKWQGMNVHPALFAAGMFVFTFLVIVAGIAVTRFVTTIGTKLHSNPHHPLKGRPHFS